MLKRLHHLISTSRLPSHHESTLSPNHTSEAGLDKCATVEVMPDERQALEKGTLYKLTTGHVKKWELREMLLTDEKLSYSIDTNASKAWNTLGLRVAESIPLLDIEKVVSTADDHVTKEGFLSRLNMSCLMCLPDEIDKKLAKENAKELLRNIVCPLRQSINHMGVVKTRGVKTRGQSNTSFKTICVVLNEGMLEYYEDERSYLFNKKRGLKGSIQTKNIKITSATFSGVDVSNDGYHFTIEDTSSGKLIECACEDAQSRDLWVGKIKASYHNATVECESVAIVVHMKPEEGDDNGRIHYFNAASEQECLKWTKALKEATANARKKYLSASTSVWARTEIKLRSIYNSDLVQFTVVGIIIANFLANVVEFELMSEDPAVMQRFDNMDLTFTILFTLELIVNLIAHLDILPSPWISDSWNVLDLLIVIISLISLTPVLGNSGGVKAIRVLRAFRVRT